MAEVSEREVFRKRDAGKWDEAGGEEGESGEGGGESSAACDCEPEGEGAFRVALFTEFLEGALWFIFRSSDKPGELAEGESAGSLFKSGGGGVGGVFWKTEADF